jgi:cell division protein FtsW
MDDYARQATRLEAIGGHYDKWLLGAAVALASLGIVMVASSSIAITHNPFYYLNRHLLFIAIGMLLAVVAMRVELKKIEEHNRLLLAACGVLLLVVFIPGLGSTVNGARRWINLGVAKFQTVEAVKVLYIVWLSSYLVRFRDEVNATWQAMLKPVYVVGALVCLLLMQPDFGSSTLLLGITTCMLVLGGAQMKRIVLPALVMMVALALLVYIEPYRMARITSFRDPWADQLGSGYQLSNALMAIGRGEWTGAGLGASVQKLNYLPEAHTDFIFSVIAEELGFAGVCCIVALYALLVGRALWLGMRCIEMRRHFAGYIAFGIALWIGLQAFVSMGVNLGILPTKGLTLPLVSSGGSSVMMTCVAIGLLLRVSWEYNRAVRRQEVREEDSEPLFEAAEDEPAATPATAGAIAAAMQRGAARGTSRMQQRVEPTFGRIA